MGQNGATGPFLALLNEVDRDRLLAAASIKSFVEGATVISADDPPGEMYVVIEGDARVSIVSEDGREVSYRDLAPGDIFGEMAMIDGGPRSAFVIARTDLRVAMITYSSWDRLAAAAPGVSLAMNRHLVAQVRSLTTRVLELSTLLVRHRLTREIRRRATPVNGGDRGVLQPAPTHAELASRIGTHREAVTKELSRLSRKGLVLRDGDALVIPSLSALGG